MSRKLFLSIIFFIFSTLLTLVPLTAQKEEGEIIVISERVGKEIDQEEREKFKLFEEIKGFQSSVYIKLPDGRYFLKITYLDEKTGELKIKRIQQSGESIKNRGKYIDNFEELQAGIKEEQRGGEIIIISERVGEEIYQEERDKYELFQNIKGFQSAICYKLPNNRYIWKIMYLTDKTGEPRFERLQQSQESINKYRYHINHFEEIQARRLNEMRANQDTVYQAPGIAFFLELGGKLWYSLNVDYRRNKSEAMSLGIQGFENTFFTSLMYYRFRGETYRSEIGGGFSGVVTDDGLMAVAIHGVLGYRYQKKKGPLFRIGFTPFIGIPLTSEGRFMIVPWAGISVGYSL